MHSCVTDFFLFFSILYRRGFTPFMRRKNLLNDGERVEHIYKTDEAALQAFIQRKEAGMNLSQRVWNLTDEYKEDLEAAISVGIEKGQTAQTLSKRIAKYLVGFDALRRDFKQKFGRAARVENCEYRAARLARTEINMAYRTAEQNRWRKLDFVLGYEVKLSHSHGHTYGQHGACEVCEALAGKYPKTFVFEGWHPNCMCYAVPILPSVAEMREYLDNDMPADAFRGEAVTQPPQSFAEFVSQNKENIQLQNPYWYRHNKGYVDEAINDGQYSSIFASTDAHLTPTEIKDITAIQSAMSKFAKENPECFSKGYLGIEAVSSSEYYMSTSLDGKISISFAVDKDGFNAGESLVSAFKKLKTGSPLTRNEEYSIEALWHEVLHNKSNNTTILPPIETTNVGFTRLVAETINQLDARHSYGFLLEYLGGSTRHSKWILENGYGYHDFVNNLRLLLSKAQIDENVFVKQADKILMNDYADIDKHITSLLLKLNKNNNLNVRYAFGMLEIKDYERFL